jgi:hypothetical protein
MSFFHKKMSQNIWATIMPFGPVTLIFLLALISGTVVGSNTDWVKPKTIKMGTIKGWFV